MSLTSDPLKAFIKVMEHRSVHGAAKIMGLTQTAITIRIQKLEESLNTTLFIRSRKGMQPTPAADSLLLYCKQVKEIEGQVLSQLEGNKKENSIHLKIHGASSIMRARVIPALEKQMVKNSNATYEFDLWDTYSGVQNLKSAKSDFVIVRRSEVVAEFDSKLLKPEQYVIAVPKKWKNRKVEDIVCHEKIIDFDPGDEMTYLLLKKYKWFEKRRRERYYANNTDALASMIGMGLGYSVLTTEFVKYHMSDDIVALHPKTYFYDYEIALAWYPRKHMHPVFTGIIKAIK